YLKNKKGTTLVISGDTPLLTSQTLDRLFEYHQAQNASATILTAQAEDPTGYGRILRDQVGIVDKIVEQKDATTKEAQITEINTGTYCFDNELLFEALAELNTDNAQGEYYLTDIIGILKSKGKIVAAYQTKNFEESLGVNDRVALAQANEIMRKRINYKHMHEGVSFIDPQTTYIDDGVEIGADTLIEAGVSIKGSTVIGENCLIMAGSQIKDSVIEDKVVINHSVIEESTIHTGADIGPFAHLRPKADIGSRAHVGNFVEIKKAQIGEDTKVGHLTYVGDATLGKKINIGCGTIFSNYDGVKKFHTNVGDHAFIGAGSTLIAPINVADHAFIAADTTVTKDVNKYDMAIGRGRQVNKPDYWHKLPLSQDKEWD